MMSRDDSEEKEHFLPHREYANAEDKQCTCRPRRTLLLHTIFLLLYICTTAIALIAYSLLNTGDAPFNTLVLSGERLALRQQRFELSEDSPYAGPPSIDIDQAWMRLLHHVNIRATGEELSSLNQTSVQLPKGQGSLVWMDVSHQLHCVKYLRQWIYRDHYHPDLAPDEVPHKLLHTDHCLDLIRQALMCRADTSLMTFEWAPEIREPMLKLESPEHTCVDWEDLMAKVESRRISDADMQALGNPSLGID